MQGKGMMKGCAGGHTEGATVEAARAQEISAWPPVAELNQGAQDTGKEVSTQWKEECSEN